MRRAGFRKEVKRIDTGKNCKMPSTSKQILKRHKCFDATHQQMIETAVQLISEKGLESLSIAALARAMGINRTTVYYHFENRDEMIKAVKAWSAEQLAAAFNPERTQRERIDYITRFVLENPALIKLWIEDLISVGDIRESYPHWDEIVTGIREHFVSSDPDNPVDAEVYCVIMLTSAIIGPRVFKNSVSPNADNDSIVERFRSERIRMLQEGSLLKL